MADNSQSQQTPPPLPPASVQYETKESGQERVERR